MFRYYLAVIFGGTAAIALIAVPAVGVSLPIALVAAFSATAFVFGVDALVAIGVRALIPNPKMDPFARVWHVFPWERRCYVRLGIRHWKDRIPETGGLLVGFSKKKVANMGDNGYILLFLRETCYAELMHLLSIPFGFLVLLLCFAWDSFAFIPSVALPVACVNAILQLLPVMVQRYVRPLLISVYRRNERRAAAGGYGIRPYG